MNSNASSITELKYSAIVLNTEIAHKKINSITHPARAITVINTNKNNPRILLPQSFDILLTLICILLTKSAKVFEEYFETKFFIKAIEIPYPIKINGCPIATNRFIINTTIINPIITFTKNPIRSGNTLYAINNNTHKPINTNILPPHVYIYHETCSLDMNTYHHRWCTLYHCYPELF